MSYPIPVKRSLAAFLLPAALLAGCAGQQAAPTSGPLFAVFPLENQSNDVDAADKVRKVLLEEMRAKGFRLVPPETVDAALKDLGVTDGGQLRAVPFERIRAGLTAERFVYGTLVDYGIKSAVAFTQRRVELKLRVLDSAGAVAFEDAGVGIVSKAGVDAAGDLALNVAGKVVKSVKDSAANLMPGKQAKKAADATDVVADVDLNSETREAVLKLLEKLPR